ncbi:S-layer homology domain-containing protein [Citricoccus sp. I39-566]|uniref:S-layer homology domain-containing protein n=1 Tax=Citricoccus sp. I39-566 TaxID=3073268 RepID=UPI00286A6DD9|nr:S-layer homology domain-containing protein [Citricoccus sp. I39-566]WMY78053.1 S-layer homology domain-containing protein [Citricoccus sp. I39-566]
MSLIRVACLKRLCCSLLAAIMAAAIIFGLGQAGPVQASSVVASDGEPPVVVDSSFTPNEWDLREGPVTVTVRARITDQTGAKAPYGYLYNPNGDSFDLEAMRLTSGDATDGWWETEIQVPTTVIGGEWTVRLNYLNDVLGNQGNQPTLGTLNISNDGGDGEPPVVVDSSFTPNEWDLREGPVTVTVRARITDQTGAKAPYGYLYNPNGDSFDLEAMRLTSGDATDGWWETEIQVPTTVIGGEWTVRLNYLNDVLGNQGNQPTLGTLNISNDGGDGEPPVVVDSSFTPNEWDLREGPVTVTVRARITDQTGAKAPYGYLYNPNGDSFDLEAMRLTSGDATDGWWETEIQVPTTVIGGEWTVRLNYLNDVLGNQGNQPTLGTLNMTVGDVAGPIPTISGGTTVGSVLSASAGRWGPDPVELAYQWNANGQPISEATTKTLQLSSQHLGKTITVTVVGSRTGYTPATTTSSPTPQITEGVLQSGTPSISGTAAVGNTVFVQPGAWGPSPIDMTFQWNAGGRPITGETGLFLIVSPELAGQELTATVKASKGGYTSSSRTTEPVIVGAGSLTTSTPIINGDALLGETLTAQPGAWGPGSVGLTYAWHADGQQIVGATENTFTLADDQVGKKVAVTVTGEKDGYNNASSTSEPTKTVLAQRDTSAPQVTSSKVTPMRWNFQDGAAEVTATVRITDPSGVEAPVLSAGHDSGQSAFFGRMSLTSGTVEDGTWTATFTIPTSAAVGSWDVSLFPLSDTLGNRTFSFRELGPVEVRNERTLETSTPTISGDASIWSTLVANPGTWGPAPVNLGYQWYADGQEIYGATQKELHLDLGLENKSITVAVTGWKYGYTTESKMSSSTAKVAPLPLTADTPTISGEVEVGSRLTADEGEWHPSPSQLTFQWNADGQPISGATGKALTLSTGHVGKAITVTVTGHEPGFTTEARTSAPTSRVLLGTLKSVAPTVTGDLAVGKTVTVSTGTWGPGEVSLAYQWKANGIAIPGATDKSLALTENHFGKTVSVTVTGTKDGYDSSSKTSAATAKIAAGTLTTATPTVTGDAKLGSPLTANPGTWGPDEVSLAYQWKADGTTIPGATGSTLKLAAGQVGKAITVTVTGTKDGYATTSKTSAPTPAIAAGVLTAPAPIVTGAPFTGQTLVVDPGTWVPADVALSYQWNANGTPIKDATSKTLPVVAGYVGRTITVTVTGTKDGYTTASKTSAATDEIAKGTLTTTTPTVTGETMLGSTLTANTGDWGPVPVDLAYQWNANGEPIKDATVNTLKLAAGHVGKTIAVTVTGTKDGYATATKTSAPTPAIAAGVLTAPEPVVTGTPVTGQTLTADPSAWAPTSVALSYQWNANGTPIPGATGKTFTLTEDQLGQTVSITVTGTLAGYTTASKTSAPTGKVTAPEAPTEPTPEVELSDVAQNAWYYAPVTWMVDRGITTGYTGGTFRPHRPVTRGEAVTFLFRYVDDQDFTVPDKATLKDVPTTHNFFEPISWATKNGVVNGYADGTFRSNKNMTRAEVAAVLYRQAKPAHTAPTKSPFTDLTPKSNQYEAITWLAEQDITTGRTDGTFDPGANVTRAELATFLQRYNGVLTK